MEFFATCGQGLEPLLGDELRALRVHGVRPLSGGVSFSGTLSDAYTALLWSRTASRVLLTLARVDAGDADALYEGTRSIDWRDHVAPLRTIAVDARGTNDVLRDTRFTALRVKDAICDQLRELTGARPDVDATHPDVLVNASLHRGKATLSIDLSGGSLEHRGYRSAGKPQGAFVRETVAAGLLLASGWDPSAGEVLVNPLCGGGIIAAEAALMAGDVAPGITRSSWGFTGWAGHDEALWAELLDEADERAAAGRGRGVLVLATDANPEHLSVASSCARRAGVSPLVSFSSDSQKDGLGRRPGVLACAVLPGGGIAEAQLLACYAQLGARFRLDAGLRALALLGEPGSAGLVGLTATRELPVRCGAGTGELCVCSQRPAPADAHEVKVRDVIVAAFDAGAQQFASRLNKVAKQRRKWAKDNGVRAYRVYDADLPDYNLAIDLYAGAGPDEGKLRVHIAEYAPPKQIDPTKAARRLGDALRIIPVVLEVSPRAVYVKRRQRAKGGSQYARAEVSPSPDRFITAENGLKFEVDLADYLDTGLFLDHRPTRQLLRLLARGKRFLNLFAYTGTASVYAATGGAASTTTVDLSNTYLHWAQRNMALNGLTDGRHQFIRADVVSWVREMRHSKNRWDLVFVDPPTFSNSTKMGSRSWDVQRDHGELLIGVSRLLAPGGAAVFSCNLRSFTPDVELLAKAGVRIADITPKTIPEDFQRNPKVHHCYLLKRAEPVLH